jgi:hypothetical protein
VSLGTGNPLLRVISVHDFADCTEIAIELVGRHCSREETEIDMEMLESIRTVIKMLRQMEGNWSPSQSEMPVLAKSLLR